NHMAIPSLIHLEIQENLSCYNKFLQYYNFPLLNYKQTIKSFLIYLKSFKFSYNTIFSFNSKLNEAYIYTSNNLYLLKNYCSLNTNELTLYSKQTLIYNFITESNSEIFRLSETHLKIKDTKFLELFKNLTNYTNY